MVTAVITGEDPKGVPWIAREKTLERASEATAEVEGV